MNPWAASIPEWVTAVTSAMALVGLLFVWLQLKAQKRQLIRDIENDYVQRYWQIRDNIDASTFGGGGEERRWRLAYVRLCEDQIDLANAVGVTPTTWRQWDAGMRAELMRFEIYRDVVKAHPDEFRGVRALMALET